MPDISTEILKDWCVLVVEDDPFSQDVAAIMLSTYGATVHTADDGIEGLKLAVQLKPDFILSDISMPGMDGWGLINGLKSDPRTTRIPVIALTAHAMKGYRERAIASGFHNFLTKPLTPETFIHELLTLLIEIEELDRTLDYTPHA